MTSSRGKKILAAGTDLALSEQIGLALEERGYSLKRASSLRGPFRTCSSIRQI